uniref:AlNc14C30G2813 protein n=1 Tax=Albugo laibachii Nc14 TaxID=890382 RepID=F0W7K7_9STRA|nr:AlNc14C30G2813 [Albugo laibachii Nc14]|eukprot:CCA17108.1 AlNc14C30G2813 [Albugo laibachii Nc14]
MVLIQVAIALIVSQQYVTAVRAQVGEKYFVEREFESTIDRIPTTYKMTREPAPNVLRNGFEGWKDPHCPEHLLKKSHECLKGRCRLRRPATEFSKFITRMQHHETKKLTILSGNKIAFVAIGNAGIPNRAKRTNLDRFHEQIGKDVAKIVRNHEAQFALFLGNTFHDGLESVDDPQWENVWAERFDVEKLDIPFFAVNGDGEKMRNKTAIGCYGEYGKHSKHWISPDLAYTLDVINAAGDFMMIFTDTEVETNEIKYGESDSGDEESGVYKSLIGDEIKHTFKVIITRSGGTSMIPHLQQYAAPDVTWMAKQQKLYEDRHPIRSPLIFAVGHRHLYSTLETDTKMSVTDHIIDKGTIHRYIQNAKVTNLPLKLKYDIYISGDVAGLEYLTGHDKRD